MPCGLASKTGVMLSSRDVRTSVLKYMVTVPKYIFRDASHYQLQLFVDRANSALGWCTCLFRVSFKLSKNGDNRLRTAENGCPIIHGVLI